MEELIDQALAVAKGMWRFRWQSLLVAWVIGIVAVVVVFRIPDEYEATARIYVDTQSILRPLMSGLAVQPNVDQQVVMLSRTLISRPNVEKLVRMADLDLKVDSKARQEELVGKLMSGLEIKSVGRDNLYTLSYRDSEPAKAQRVIQALVSIFVESSLGNSRSDTATAKLFINDQIKSYEEKLQEAEAKLKQFKLKNINLQFSEGKDSAAQLATLADQLDAARVLLHEAEHARDAARTQLNNEKAANANLTTQSLLQESAVNLATPEIDSRIDVQKRNLDTLLQRYTDQHPDVIATRHLIQELEEQKKKQVAELRKAAMTGPGVGSSNNNENLVYQELNRLLATSEVQVAGLQARVADYSARYERAKDAIKTAPQLEAEASQLNRDYTINKKNYEDLVARRESAVMSGDLESASGVADFRLIDPPRVSNKPVSPNRLVLLGAALLASLGAGFGFAFLASQLRPVFFNTGDLRAHLELPVLGIVSRVTSDAERRLEKVYLMRFLAGSGSLVGIFVATIVVMSVVAARRAGGE
ncbi:MAG: XrtA system polysaccharide chain length determinant [Vitreoscilla sp.]